MDILINYHGKAVQPGRRSIVCAVSGLGFIHLQALGGTVIFSLQPMLVHSLTLAGAFYALADLRPERIIVVDVATQKCGAFDDFRCALRRVHSLVPAAVRAEAYTSAGTDLAHD